MTILAELILSWIVAHAPGWLGKHLYHPADFERDLMIRLRTTQPVAFSLSSFVPNVYVYFEITNMSPVSVELHSSTVRVWVGQPLVDCVRVEREVIPKRSAECVACSPKLGGLQVQRLQQKVEDMKELGREVRGTLYAAMEFNSPLGRITREENIEYAKPTTS